MNSWSWTRRVAGPRDQRRAAAALLTRCVRGEAADDPSTPSRLSSIPSEMLLSLADYHGVAGMAYEQLRSIDGADEGLIAELRRAYGRAVEGHLRVLWELTRLQPVLDATGVPWAVIKGPAAVERLYEVPGRRSYQDLDLLVEPSGFADVLAALQSYGSSVLDRNWTVLRRDLLGEVHLRLPGGTPLDLHWNLINMNRGRMWIDSREVLARSVTADIGSLAVRVLEREDMLLHHAVHAALSGGDKLLWLKDVERVATVLQPDWPTLVDRARAWGVAAPAGLILARTRDVLDAPIPAAVPRALLGRPAMRLVRVVERISPWELSVGRLTAASHVVSRSISHGPGGAAMWFIRRSLKRLDPREPEASSAFTARGDEVDRQAFIEAVVGSGAHRRAVP